MIIHILGSAAGGGFPQWNCNCRNCAGVRAGTIKTSSRTQSSIAVSQDGASWVLINASPDILTQIRDFPEIQPARQVRDTGIAAVILTDAQIDHVTGLLMLREGCPLNLYCTPQVEQDLSHGFPLFSVLDHWNGGYTKHLAPLDGAPFTIYAMPRIRFTALPLVSNAPPYSPHRDNPEPGDNIGLLIEDTDTGNTLFYAPGVGRIEDSLIDAASLASHILIDGTVWTNDEMARQGVGEKTGTEMGHLPQSGDGGMIEFLDSIECDRKILIHINNTNPILNENSAERAILEEHNIEVAFDGMNIIL